MATPDQALATQRRNIETKIGRDLETVRTEIAASSKLKHGEVRTWLMETYELGYGDANSLAHFASGSKGAQTELGSEGDPFAEIYAGKKQHLRAIHDALIAAIGKWGHFEIAPKKGYVALRRKKQFAMLGPKNTERAELGLNLKDDAASDRVVALKPGGMCQFAVALHGTNDIDDELLRVLRRAFDAAG